MKKLNIGMIGYGFMGRTHSNAYRKVNNFFDLQYRPVLKAVSGRDAAKVKEFAYDVRPEAVDAAGFHINCYVDDLLYVAEVTPEARAYADFQGLEIHEVGPLREWLHDDPTKLVAVGDPAALDALEAELGPRFRGRLFVSKSLPYFLEFAHPDVSKGAGLQWVAERLGFTAAETVACGDGENDRELLDWAGFGVAVANAQPEILARADLVVPDVEHEGVADLLDAYLEAPTE